MAPKTPKTVPKKEPKPKAVMHARGGSAIATLCGKAVNRSETTSLDDYVTCPDCLAEKQRLLNEQRRSVADAKASKKRQAQALRAAKLAMLERVAASTVLSGDALAFAQAYAALSGKVDGR